MKVFDEFIYTNKNVDKIKEYNLIPFNQKEAYDLLKKGTFALAKNTITEKFYSIETIFNVDNWNEKRKFNKLKEKSFSFEISPIKFNEDFHNKFKGLNKNNVNKTYERLLEIAINRDYPEKYEKILSEIKNLDLKIANMEEKAEKVDFFRYWAYSNIRKKIKAIDDLKQPMVIYSHYQVRDHELDFLRVLASNLLINLVGYKKVGVILDIEFQPYQGINKEHPLLNKKEEKKYIVDAEKYMSKRKIKRVSNNFHLFKELTKQEKIKLYKVRKSKNSVLNSELCNEALEFFMEEGLSSKEFFLKNYDPDLDVNSFRNYLFLVENNKPYYGKIPEGEVSNEELFYMEDLDYFTRCLDLGLYKEEVESEENISFINHLIYYNQVEKLKILKDKGLFTLEGKDEDGDMPQDIIKLTNNQEIFNFLV